LGLRKQVAAAAERNKGPILEILRRHLPASLAPSAPSTVLEVASGTGQHAAYMASQFPHLTWQPSECTRDSFDSIKAWSEGIANVRPPLLLDASTLDECWPARVEDKGNESDSVIACVCINMTHIAPYSATQGLFRGAGKVQGRPICMLVIQASILSIGLKIQLPRYPSVLYGAHEHEHV
jgi:hypothetical protein